MRTIQITLPRAVADQAFGFYLHSQEPKADYDLSAFHAGTAFEEEVSQRVKAMPRESQITTQKALKRVLGE